MAELNQRAGDARLSRADRCGAVFRLFEKHVHAGMTAAEARQVLADRTWLVQSVDEPVTIIAGLIPVEGGLDGSVFVVRCLARPRSGSGWVIYGRVSDGAAATLGAFLGGGGRLLEYALCYPDGRLVQHRAGGRVVRGNLARLWGIAR